MPSIGDIEIPRNSERSLEEVSSIISEELVGQNTTSTLKSTGVNDSRKDNKPAGAVTTAMAPQKDGPVESECKTPAESLKKMIQPGTQEGQAEDMPANGEQKSSQNNGVEAGKETNGCHIQEDNDHQSENGKTGEDGDDLDGQKERTADEKRKDYKEKPKASSVEILGLKKKQMVEIANQGQLDMEILQGFEKEMKRRKSSPAKFHYRKIPEESESVDSLAAGMKTMNLEGAAKKPGFGQRIEEQAESQRNDLVAKGPVRPGHQQVRQAPYQAGQATIAFQTNPGQMQQIIQTPMAQPMYHDRSAQQYASRGQVMIRPSHKKVSVPGMQSQQVVYTRTADGRVLQNVSIANQVQQNSMQVNHQQMPVVRRVPVEDSWPPSPADASYPNSPGSTESLSPSHIMQTSPAPSYASPNHPLPSPMMPSPQSMIPSPQSIMSPDGYCGMSTSPNSPLSPDMVPLNSPPSVRSDDSGIASPPHQTSHYSTFTSTNCGTVIDTSTPIQTKIIHYPPVQNYQYQLTQQELHQQHRQQSEEAMRQQKIKSIEDHLISSVKNFETTQNQPQQSIVPMTNMNIQPHKQRHNVYIHDGMSQQVHVPAGPQFISPKPVQVVQQPPSPLDQAQNLENLVLNMPLEVLCSLDEDEDTALHIAISQGNLQLCQAIINRLVNEGRQEALNIKDKLGQTPLYIAVVTNQPNLLFFLLQAGADVMIPNKDRNTALHYAATKGYAHALVAIGYCLCNDMITNWDINAEDKHGMSPLQCAIQAHGHIEQVYDGMQCTYVNKMVDSLDTIKNLLKLGADPGFQDRRSGFTALHFAMELAPNEKVTGNLIIMKQILDWNRDAQALLAKRNYAGNTALHIIAGRNHKEDYLVAVVDLLISCGAEINVTNHEKNQPHDLVKKNVFKKLYSRLQGDHLQGK